MHHKPMNYTYLHRNNIPQGVKKKIYTFQQWQPVNRPKDLEPAAKRSTCEHIGKKKRDTTLLGFVPPPWEGNLNP